MSMVKLAAAALSGLLLFASHGAGAADDTVKIGLIIPLSPPGDPTAGQLIRRGGDLAVEYVNSVMGGVLGKKIEIVSQDSQGRPEAGVAAYRKLASEDKAIGVTG